MVTSRGLSSASWSLVCRVTPCTLPSPLPLPPPALSILRKYRCEHMCAPVFASVQPAGEQLVKSRRCAAGGLLFKAKWPEINSTGVHPLLTWECEC